MVIIHYSLGIYPQKKGGLSKYVTDLASIQSKNGHKVYLIYPGRFSIFEYSTKIKFHREKDGINSIEIVNPLPVSIFSGISSKNIKHFIKSGSQKVYLKLFLKLKPDLIHFHTLMGLHKEFILTAKDLQIKTFFSTHDFFGLCPLSSLYKINKSCKHINIGNHCNSCNISSLNIEPIKFRHSSFYNILKNNKLMYSFINYFFYSAFFKSLINFFFKIFNFIKINKSENYYNSINNYDLLHEFYQTILHKFDYFIFNSSITENNYKLRVKLNNNYSKVVLSHKDIQDNRKIKNFTNEFLTIGYMTSTSISKGYYLIKDVVKELYEEGYNIKLNIYNNDNNKAPYIKNCGKFNHSQLPKIFKEIDLLVVPSLAYETFSFLTLEAISFAVPVLITNVVGAKDIIVHNKTGLIAKTNKESLKNEIMKCFESNLLTIINENLLIGSFPFTLDLHYDMIMNIYSNILKDSNV